MKKILTVILALFISMLNITGIQAADEENNFKIHFINVGNADAILVQCNGENMLIDGGYATKYNVTNNKNDENIIDQLISQIPKNNGDTTMDSMEEMDSYLEKLQKVFQENANAQNDTTRYLDSIGIKHIDHVVASHPHFDHIGGLIAVLNRYEIGDIMAPNIGYTTNYYHVFMNMMVKVLQDKEYNSSEDEPVVDPLMSVPYLSAGDVFYLGKDKNQANNAKITVLNPSSTDIYDNMNNYSLTLRVDYKNTAYLLTSDIQQDAQKNIIARYGNNRTSNEYSDKDLLSDIDVLKIPHHGYANMESLPSSEYHSGNFLLTKTVDPNIAIATTAFDANYPAPALHSVKVQRELAYSNLYSTAMGTVVLSSDGNKITTQNALASSRSIRIVNPRSSSIKLTNIDANLQRVISKKPITLQLEYRYGKNSSLSYMYVPEGKTYNPNGTWTSIGNNGKVTLSEGMHGTLYFKAMDTDGNTVFAKTSPFIIDSKAPTGLVIKASGISGIKTLTTGKSNSYKKTTTKPIKFTFSAKDTTGIDHYEYQFIKSGVAYHANKGWKKVKGNSVTLSTNCKGRFYVRAVDRVGNSTARKSTGFIIKHRLGATVSLNGKSTSVKKLGGKDSYPKANSANVAVNFKVNSADPSKNKYKIYYHLAKAGTSYNKSFKWTKGGSVSIKRNFKGVVYAKFVGPDKHTTIVKSSGININNRATSIQVSANVKGVKPKYLSTKNTYSIKSRKPIKLKVSASYGDPYKYKIQYKIVKKGKAYKKTGGWKNGTTIRLKGKQSARVYVKFKNKTTGRETIRKLGGFKIY